MIGDSVQQLVDMLASPSETKFCDIHRFSLVKDVHGAALSALTFIYCLCFMMRIMADSRSSKKLRWVYQSHTVMTFLATANHVWGKKYNDFMFVGWSVFVSAPAKLDFYDEAVKGGAWYYEVVPRHIYKYSRILTLATIFDPRYAGFFFFPFVFLPSQPREATITSRMSNLFVVLSLCPIFYELVNEGRCPYGLPVHALSDACVLFVSIWSLIHLQDVALESYVEMANGKKD